MKNKTARFLIISIIVVITVCILVFTVQAVYMNQKSAETIGEIGGIYMSGMSEQVSMHFETLIETRLEQVQALADFVSPSSGKGSHTMRVQLSYYARARGFSTLALCSDDGAIEMIYGNQVTIPQGEDVFLESLCNGEDTMVLAGTSAGENIILMGVPIAYPMADGGRSVALVAGFSVDYIGDTLSLQVDDDMLYAIISREGEFIVRGKGMDDSSYFERVRTHYEWVEGDDKEQLIRELGSAMAAEEIFTREVLVDGERRQMYCSNLPNSEWYLLISMSYATLDNTLESFGGKWARTAVGNGVVILLVLLAVFAKYFQLTRRQIRDLDEARQAAEHASRAKSEFLSNMSHDIHTPMNGIVGMAAIAGANLSDEKQVRDCLKRISVSSRQLLGMINNILDISKIESGRMALNMESVSLSELAQNVANIVQTQAKEKQQHFDVYIYHVPIENVYSDTVRLRQVLLNLLDNAVKFTPENGSIQLLLQQEPSVKGEDYIRLMLRVKDNGIGFDAEFKEKLFDTFMREDTERIQKAEGAGLGLAITKYIVDAMGGTIEVESEPGKGSEFWVTLDLKKAPAWEEETHLPAWKALVIEDNKQLCSCTVETLQAIGIHADWALDIDTALKMLQEQRRKGDEYQVLLLDKGLTKVDSLEVVRKIRQLFDGELRILLGLMDDRGEIEEEAKAAGVNGFIERPLFQSTLHYALRQFAESSDTMVHMEPNFSGQRILVAEDIDLNWEIVNMLLTEADLQMERAENGQICVDKFAQSPVGYYSAVLMDIRMPNMTGYEASIAIRTMNRPDAETIPIIAMSADAFADDVQRCLDCGMNAHIAKPIDMQQVLHKLGQYLKKE